MAKFGPTLAAIVVVLFAVSPATRTRFLNDCLRWRVPLRWYAVALLAPLALWAIPLAIHFASTEDPAPPNWSALPAAVPSELVQRAAFGGGLGEEPGWRGFALPQLETRLAPLPATLALGATWGLWHAPAVFLPNPTDPERDSAKSGGGVALILFTLLTTALCVLFTYLYHASGASVPLCILAHGAFNATENVIKATLPSVAADGSVTIFYGLTVLLAAILLVVVTWGRLGRPRETAPAAA